MDDIKFILKVEKHRDLYDTQHQFYKDNEECWDAVGAAVTLHLHYRTEPFPVASSLGRFRKRLDAASKLTDLFPFALQLFTVMLQGTHHQSSFSSS